MAEQERRQSDIELAGLRAEVNGLKSLMETEISALTKSLDLLREAVDKMETRGETACGKCREGITEELTDVWKEVKSVRSRVEVLEKATGENAKKVFKFIATAAGGIGVTAFLYLIWDAIKEAVKGGK